MQGVVQNPSAVHRCASPRISWLAARCHSERPLAWPSFLMADVVVVLREALALIDNGSL